MPSGTHKNEERVCGICKKTLRPLYKNEDWPNRKYHVSCFKAILRDINNYNKVCFDKYNHRKKVGGVFVDEIKEDTKFTISWD